MIYNIPITMMNLQKGVAELDVGCRHAGRVYVPELTEIRGIQRQKAAGWAPTRQAERRRPGKVNPNLQHGNRKNRKSVQLV